MSCGPDFCRLKSVYLQNGLYPHRARNSGCWAHRRRHGGSQRESRRDCGSDWPAERANLSYRQYLSAGSAIWPIRPTKRSVRLQYLLSLPVIRSRPKGHNKNMKMFSPLSLSAKAYFQDRASPAPAGSQNMKIYIPHSTPYRTYFPLPGSELLKGRSEDEGGRRKGRRLPPRLLLGGVPKGRV